MSKYSVWLPWFLLGLLIGAIGMFFIMSILILDRPLNAQPPLLPNSSQSSTRNSSPSNQNIRFEPSYVSRVIDGDTVVLNDTRHVRLICINTPEKGQPNYNEATILLTSYILNKTVILEKDVSETDRYGRLLRYIYLGNFSVNKAMVASGLAVVDRFPPDIRHCDEYEKAGEESRIGKP